MGKEQICAERDDYGGTATPEMGWQSLHLEVLLGIQLAKVQKLREASWSTLIGALFKGRAVLQPVA